jgi:hypothetical protein
VSTCPKASATCQVFWIQTEVWTLNYSTVGFEGLNFVLWPIMKVMTLSPLQMKGNLSLNDFVSVYLLDEVLSILFAPIC